MACEVIWSRAARDDLRDIDEHLSARDLRAAARIIGKIEEGVDSLKSFPELGPRICDDLRGRRCLVREGYHVAYRFEKAVERVYILSVSHGSREFLPPR